MRWYSRRRKDSKGNLKRHMRNKIINFGFVILLAVAVMLAMQSWNGSILAKDKDAAWEYTYQSLNLDHPDSLKILNQMGSEGWELVTVKPAMGNGDNYTYYLFKKKKK